MLAAIVALPHDPIGSWDEVAMADAVGEADSYPRTTDMAVMAARCYPETLAFYKYWLSKVRGTRTMPSRADLDPAEMKVWLPCLQLIDVHDNPRRLIYRLVGESEVTVRGYNPTGRAVAETAIGQGTSDPMGNYGIVIDGKKPVYDFSKINHPQGFLISQECLLLPLSDDGQRVNMVVTYGKVISSLPQKLKR